MGPKWKKYTPFFFRFHSTLVTLPVTSKTLVVYDALYTDTISQIDFFRTQESCEMFPYSNTPGKCYIRWNSMLMP